MTITLFIIAIILPFLASLLTFFSGFGINTLLLPAFALLMPIDAAIITVGSVHFLNNLLKLLLVGKKTNVKAALSFGLPAIVTAFIGATLLTLITYTPEIFSYTINTKTFHVDLLHIVIGLLMILFAIMDLWPVFTGFSIQKKHLPIGGALSGFFGGLSGHAGAFRSAFLLKAGLTKEGFIATGVVVSCAVDTVRLLTYGFTMPWWFTINNHLMLFILAVLSAWAGAIVGNQTLHLATVEWLKWSVGIMLMIFGILMILGII